MEELQQLVDRYDGPGCNQPSTTCLAQALFEAVVLERINREQFISLLEQITYSARGEGYNDGVCAAFENPL